MSAFVVMCRGNLNTRTEYEVIGGLRGATKGLPNRFPEGSPLVKWEDVSHD